MKTTIQDQIRSRIQRHVFVCEEGSREQKFLERKGVYPIICTDTKLKSGRWGLPSVVVMHYDVKQVKVVL